MASNLSSVGTSLEAGAGGSMKRAWTVDEAQFAEVLQQQSLRTVLWAGIICPCLAPCLVGAVCRKYCTPVEERRKRFHDLLQKQLIETDATALKVSLLSWLDLQIHSATIPFKHIVDIKLIQHGAKSCACCPVRDYVEVQVTVDPASEVIEPASRAHLGWPTISIKCVRDAEQMVSVLKEEALRAKEEVDLRGVELGGPLEGLAELGDTVTIAGGSSKLTITTRNPDALKQVQGWKIAAHQNELKIMYNDTTVKSFTVTVGKRGHAVVTES